MSKYDPPQKLVLGPDAIFRGVMKCKSTGSLVATFLGTDNLRHPYNSIVYCGSSFPYSIQIVNDIPTTSTYLASQFIQVGIQGSKQCNTRDKFRQLLDHYIAKYYNSSHATLILKHKSQQTNTLDHSNKDLF